MHRYAIKARFRIFQTRSRLKSVPNLGLPNFLSSGSVQLRCIASRRVELIFYEKSRYAAHFQTNAGVVVFGGFCGEFLKLAVF